MKNRISKLTGLVMTMFCLILGTFGYALGKDAKAAWEDVAAQSRAAAIDPGIGDRII